MIYYMCKQDFLNYPKYNSKGFPVFTGELLTEKEMEKYSMPKHRFIRVIAKKTDTYFCFGVRRFFRGSEIAVAEENF